MFWYRITEEKDIHGKGVCPFLVAKVYKNNKKYKWGVVT